MTTEYEAKVVRILDALHEHEELDNTHTLQLLLQDVEEAYVFQVTLIIFKNLVDLYLFEYKDICLEFVC